MRSLVRDGQIHWSELRSKKTAGINLSQIQWCPVGAQLIVATRPPKKVSNIRFRKIVRAERQKTTGQKRVHGRPHTDAATAQIHRSVRGQERDPSALTTAQIPAVLNIGGIDAELITLSR